jgi:hypothetical protein
MNASGGYSWLVMENQDRQNIYSMNASIEHVGENDKVAMTVLKNYTAQFTTNLYGIYDTRSASLTWERKLLTALSGTADLTYQRTIPTKGTIDQEQTDSGGRVSLAWNPINYLNADLSYQHLMHKYEISGTVRENRYRMSIEVRY